MESASNSTAIQLERRKGIKNALFALSRDGERAYFFDRDNRKFFYVRFCDDQRIGIEIEPPKNDDADTDDFISIDDPDIEAFASMNTVMGSSDNEFLLLIIRKKKENLKKFDEDVNTDEKMEVEEDEMEEEEEDDEDEEEEEEVEEEDDELEDVEKDLRRWFIIAFKLHINEKKATVTDMQDIDSVIPVSCDDGTLDLTYLNELCDDTIWDGEYHSPFSIIFLESDTDDVLCAALWPYREKFCIYSVKINLSEKGKIFTGDGDKQSRSEFCRNAINFDYCQLPFFSQGNVFFWNNNFGSEKSTCDQFIICHGSSDEFIDDVTLTAYGFPSFYSLISDWNLWASCPVRHSCNMPQCSKRHCSLYTIGYSAVAGKMDLLALNFDKPTWKRVHSEKTGHGVTKNASMWISTTAQKFKESDGTIILHGDCADESCPDKAHIYYFPLPVRLPCNRLDDDGWNLKYLSGTLEHVKHIGGGAQCEGVKQYVDTLDERHFAIKRMKLNLDKTFFNLYNEVRVLVELCGRGESSRYIIRYRNAWTDPIMSKEQLDIFSELNLNDKQVYMYIQMELCEQDLEDRLNEERDDDCENAIHWCTQLLLGIRFMHDQKIIHGDIHTGNIFIDDRDTVKIADFGSANVNRSDDSNKTIDFEQLAEVIVKMFAKTHYSLDWKSNKDLEKVKVAEDSVVLMIEEILSCDPDTASYLVAEQEAQETIENKESLRELTKSYRWHIPDSIDPMDWARLVTSLRDTIFDKLNE